MAKQILFYRLENDFNLPICKGSSAIPIFLIEFKSHKHWDKSQKSSNWSYKIFIEQRLHDIDVFYQDQLHLYLLWMTIEHTQI